MRDLYNQFRKTTLNTLLASCVLILLQACSTSSGTYTNNTKPWLTPTGAPIESAEPPSDLSVAAVKRQALDAPDIRRNNIHPQNQGGPTIRVAILLPLSGENSKLGQSMLGAAQMAVFDLGHKNFELMPYDTMGTPAGARIAAHNALNDGAKLILGPVFAPAVKAARQVTQSANVNMIAFTTDWSLANSQTYLIGFLPFDQVERVMNYSDYKGLKRICAISPSDTYGNAVVSTYNSIAPRAGITPCIERFNTNKNSLSTSLRRLSNYDQRQAIKASKERALIAEGKTPEQARLILASTKTPEDLPFDAILMPVGGPLASEVGSYLSHYDLPSEKVRRIGTGLMDDNTLAHDKSLNGAWFAAPEPQARVKFKRRYNQFYSNTPPRLASLAYDATALAAILAQIGLKKNGEPAYNRESITNPNGFSGVDGIFRFRPDGIVERGLAILEYKNGHIKVVDNAPKTFQNLSQ
jgi:ABC-type branched-subunit amino acid transport system substrate-binding protein